MLIQKKLTIPVNGVSFDMIYVEGGTFMMGALPNDNDASDNEKPSHQVTLNSYYIGETEVTQDLWQTVMGNVPSYFRGNKQPVEQVSWNDCQEFIRKLNSLTGKNFRLPTEAEWEFAARGGNKSCGYKYSGSNNIGNVAWYNDNSNWKCNKSFISLYKIMPKHNCDKQASHPVKQKHSNELGIYDMSGNVWEWCQDRYGYYSSSSQDNPTGPSEGLGRIIRGGSWISNAKFCRSSFRLYLSPNSSGYYLGFRLALSLSE